MYLLRFGTPHALLYNRVIYLGTPKSRCYPGSRSYIDFLFTATLAWKFDITTPSHKWLSKGPLMSLLLTASALNYLEVLHLYHMPLCMKFSLIDFLPHIQVIGQLLIFMCWCVLRYPVLFARISVTNSIIVRWYCIYL